MSVEVSIMHDILVGLQNTGFATAIREGVSLFPWIESVHVLAIVLVVGTISIIDMRLLGLPAHRRGVRRLMKEVLPLTWGAFLVAVISGFLLFSSAAVKYAALWAFQAKMLLLVAAGPQYAVLSHRHLPRCASVGRVGGDPARRQGGWHFVSLHLDRGGGAGAHHRFCVTVS
jgi:hypothetical protein